MHQSERAVFDLRRGLPVLIRAADGDRVAYPVERGSALLDALEPAEDAALALVLRRPRLAALGLPADDDARLPARLRGPIARDRLAAWATGDGRPADDAFGPLEPAGSADRAALALMRRARLIPAAITGPVTPELEALAERGPLLRVEATEAADCADQAADRVRRVSEAPVPLADAPDSRFVLFREADGLREHIAVVIGQPESWPDPVPVRLHSACLTGDLFGSLRCDCGEQLRNAVATIARLGGGVLLYLDQEGRGIGLANKLRAYTLQDAGHDTVDADGLLGFHHDERRFASAASMLESVGVKRCRLLTNNPSKIEALTAHGIEVHAREAVYGRLTEQNRRYLSAKAERSGHLLDDVLDAES
ncbi:GTP cyclohydrolase II RibA [Wenzhouxiangella sp. XN79A]|uniref:GTP cyclohydrolase II RibA n=1 Tax=Wenzhouxiangella sp. XN79A TaxID=2724193 RepID=UPI00144ADC21|nr:GTP cyclohydrolase II RibA [Wenzhouxiangella sp. XN79A]NKI33981.1 GTP cyclohydrolase II RibA [Wenzhouxiangella sp. XN79A]